MGLEGKTMPWRVSLRVSALAVAAVILAGCVPLSELSSQKTTNPQPSGQYYVNQALAGLALGDYRYAEQMADQALKKEPQNPVALLGLGGVYQKTGRPGEARIAYQAAASMPDPVEIPGDLWGLPKVAPVRDIAQHALAQLNGATTAAPAKAITTMPVAHSMGRHAILKALRDRNLITPEEYEPRRNAPIPTSMKGAVPTLDEIADRLDQISQAYATRNLTAAEHAAEREEILNSLVPAPAGSRQSSEGIANQKADPTPPAPAKGDAKDEAKAEKKDEKPAAPAAPAAAAAPAEEKKPTPPPGSDVGQNPEAVLRSGRDPLKIVPYTPEADGGQTQNIGGPSVHLASFRSREGAMKGWDQLKAKYPDLQPLQPRITTLTLPDQGTFFRLNAGPLPDMNAAKAMCEKLKDQFCEPVMLGG